MVSSKNMIRSVFWTFIIGMIAGISPFLFMQLLPALLNPNLHLDSPNYLAILLTGLLVGIITSIIFATKFENKEPQDVFFYALGIPAILIATVTNISTEFKAVSKVSEVKESLTSVVLYPPRPETIPEAPKLLSPPQAPRQSSQIQSQAWAEENSGYHQLILAQAHGYFVVIGEYNSEKAAWDDYYKFRDMKLRTERYFPKGLNVFQISTGSYVLVYSQSSTLEDAIKVYQLLRINDPELPVRILKY
jgi:hypothetical protein